RTESLLEGLLSHSSSSDAGSARFALLSCGFSLTRKGRNFKERKLRYQAVPAAFCLLPSVLHKLLAPRGRDGAQLRGFFFRQRVVQEASRARLHAGKIFQLVLRAVRRIELDVEMEIRSEE